MDLLMLILMALIPVILDGLTVHSPSSPLVVPLHASVILPCYVNKLLTMEGLEVEWRRTDSETLVHLYQDGKSRPEAQHPDYQDRAHFFTDEIKHGNFSLRLDNLRAEDRGEYTCEVYSQQDFGETVVEIKDVERLLVFGPGESISVSVGEDVTLNCSVDSHITPELFEVMWTRTDEYILVLVYQNSETLTDLSDEQYRYRVEFFTDEIPKGNFSLKLKSVRTEDKGVYMCHVFAGGASANATAVLERLGFSDLHIIIMILCISACGSALLLCCMIYCRTSTKGFFVQQTSYRIFHLGSSVVLPCHVDCHLLKKNLKVEWTRKNPKTVVHLYQNERPEAQHPDYQNRAHFFTDEIKHGNFSLRLDNLRAEDRGEYTCEVYSLKTFVYSAKTYLEARLKVKGTYGPQTVPLGDSVVLPCQVEESLLQSLKKVEWKRTDSETLVNSYHLDTDEPEAQHRDYQDRAHFFTKKFKDGNFSLCLEKWRAEDEGEYTCKVYNDKECLYTAITELKLEFDVSCPRHTLATLGSSVILPCYADELSVLENLEVKWRRTDSGTLVLHNLYQNDPQEDQHQDYQERAHFLIDENKNGNFSLRLDNLRAEDEGEYTCEFYSKKRHVISMQTNLVQRLLVTVYRLQMFLVFCPNILMFLAFVLWGISEGSVNESVSCCALYFLRPLMLLWAAPYVSDLTGNIKTLILKYSYVAEYVALSVVVYSVLFTSAWKKLLHYAKFERVVVIVLFAMVFVSCFSKIIYFLFTEIGKKKGRIINIFDLVAEMTFEILPTLQFILLFFTFGSAEGGFIMIVILPVLLMMTNEKWVFNCKAKLDCSRSVISTVMLIFTLVINAMMFGLYIKTLENKTDPIGWGCVIVFLQILWMVMKFTDVTYISLRLDQGFCRFVPAYVFGSVGVVLLNSVSLMTELILKTMNGDRTLEDLRFIVFSSESLFALSVVISGFFPSEIKMCLQFCQNVVKSKQRKSQQNNNTAGRYELTPLKKELESVDSQT